MDRCKHRGILSIKPTKKYLSTKENFTFLGIYGFGLIALMTLFFVTRGYTPNTSELAFREYSVIGSKSGSVIPASCDAAPWLTANGDGNYTGCVTETCWNGTVVMPAMGQACPARPTVTCWNGIIITPSLGEVCQSQYCGDGAATASIYSNCTCSPARPIQNSGIPPVDPLCTKCVTTTVYWCQPDPAYILPAAEIHFN